MMLLAEKSFDGCNSIVYFVITIKGTGEEPKRLRWMAFSFSNLMAFSLLSLLVCQSSKSGGILLPTSILYFYTQYALWRKWTCSKVPINNIRTEYRQVRESIFIDCITQRWPHTRRSLKDAALYEEFFLFVQRKCQELFGTPQTATWPHTIFFILVCSNWSCKKKNNLVWVVTHQAESCERLSV